MNNCCPNCGSTRIFSYRSKGEIAAKCTRCKWEGRSEHLVPRKPFKGRLLQWLGNAWIRTQLNWFTFWKRREIEKVYKEEKLQEGAFSYIPVIDNHIEAMLVKKIADMGYDPKDARTFVEHLKIRRRTSSLTWEIDEREVMHLTWVDRGNGEIIYRLKDLNASRLTLITKSTDIQRAPSDIKIVGA